MPDAQLFGQILIYSAIPFFLVAALYASVGHAGASGYLAAMALMGVASTVMKPAALVLNVLVSIIVTTKFARARAFSWQLFWPLALASVPCAFIGGRLNLPAHLYKPLVGFVLLFAAAWSVRKSFQAVSTIIKQPPLCLLLLRHDFRFFVWPDGGRRWHFS